MSDEKNVSEEFPSAKLLLDVSRYEYDKEFSRTDTIDNKANIALTFASVLLVAVAPTMNINKLLNIPIYNFFEAILPVSYLFLIVTGMILLLCSIFSLINVISTKPYKTIDVQSQYDRENLKTKEDLLSSALINYYIKATVANGEINFSRVKKYKKALYLMVLSMVLLVVSFVIGNSIL